MLNIPGELWNPKTLFCLQKQSVTQNFNG